MSGVLEVTLKQGPVREPLTVRVDAAGISVRRGAGRERRMNFASIRDVHYVSEYTSRWIEITNTDGDRIMIMQPANFPGIGTSADKAAFTEVVAEILRRYAMTRTDATVSLGMSSRSRWRTMALVCVVMAVIIPYSIMDRGKTDVATTAIFVVILAASMGWTFWSKGWMRAPEQRPAAEVAAGLKAGPGAP